MFGRLVKLLIASSFFSAFFLKKKSKKDDISEPSDKFNAAFKSDKNIQSIEIEDNSAQTTSNFQTEKIEDKIQSPG
jgi:hypothetical protein